MRLSAHESRMVGVVARALLPAGALGGVLDAVDVGARFAGQVARSPWWSSLSLRFALWLVWLAPLASWRPRTFASLDEESRVALLERLAASPRYAVRETVMLLKLTLCMALLGDPAVLARLQAYDFAPRPRAATLRGAS